MAGPLPIPAPGPYKPIAQIHRWKRQYGELIVREYRDGEITVEFKPPETKP